MRPIKIMFLLVSLIRRVM